MIRLYALSSSQIHFPFFLSQNLIFFPHTPKPIPVKLQSRAREPLDHRETWTTTSKLIFAHYNRWDLQNNIFRDRNSLRTKIMKLRLQSLLILSNAWKP